MRDLWTTHLRSRYQRLADLAQTPIPSETTVHDFRGRTVANPLIVMPLVVGRATAPPLSPALAPAPAPALAPAPIPALPSAPSVPTTLAPVVLETPVATPLSAAAAISNSSISTMVEPAAMITEPVQAPQVASPPKSKAKTYIALILIVVGIYLIRKYSNG